MKANNTSQTTNKSKEVIKQLIALLDLDCVKIRLINHTVGPIWSRNKADLVAQRYKQFLYLSATSNTPIVPTRDIDTFWHEHILDTRKYADDCERTFGFFLHHFTYFGMRGEEDAKHAKQAFEATKCLYEAEFGGSYEINLSDSKSRAYCSGGGDGGGGCTRSSADINQHIRPSLLTVD